MFLKQPATYKSKQRDREPMAFCPVIVFNCMRILREYIQLISSACPQGTRACAKDSQDRQQTPRIAIKIIFYLYSDLRIFYIILENQFKALGHYIIRLSENGCPGTSQSSPAQSPAIATQYPFCFPAAFGRLVYSISCQLSIKGNRTCSNKSIRLPVITRSPL